MPIINSVGEKVWFTINGPLKTLFCNFCLFHFSKFKMNIAKNLMENLMLAINRNNGSVENGVIQAYWILWIVSCISGFKTLLSISDRTFCRNNYRLNAVNYFCKTFNHRYLTVSNHPSIGCGLMQILA